VPYLKLKRVFLFDVGDVKDEGWIPTPSLKLLPGEKTGARMSIDYTNVYNSSPFPLVCIMRHPIIRYTVLYVHIYDYARSVRKVKGIYVWRWAFFANAKNFRN
jgi:hypothetical protein